MNDISPLDALADELGAVAARIEREARLSVAVFLAEAREEVAKLRASRAETEMQIVTLLQAVKDGPPGPRGEPGERGERGEGIVGAAGEQGIPGPPGEPGEPAPVGEVCGLHDPARIYRRFDLVVRDGAEWRARCDDPGALPGVGWALSAEQGKRGKPGEKGERGAVGPAGMPGPSGATIVDWAVEEYRAAPIMSDGTTGPVLDLRGFFALYHGEAR